MNIALPETAIPIRLRFHEPLTDEALLRFCAENDPLRIEREPNGELSLMSPSGLEGSGWNSDIVTDLTVWARQDGRGKVFDSNAGFTLPDGSMRAPDAAWVSWERWNALGTAEQKRFGRIVPEFVIELRSESDRLSYLQTKMDLWLSNGVSLAWLVDPSRKVVEVYRRAREVEVQEGHSAVYGEGPVDGFVLELGRIWG